MDKHLIIIDLDGTLVQNFDDYDKKVEICYHNKKCFH